MKYTVNEAASIVGIVRQTLYKHIKSKGITTETDENGELVIDASELTRVYGNDVVANGLGRRSEATGTVAERQLATASRSKINTFNTTSQAAADDAVRQLLERELEILREERERERKQFEQQVDALEQALEKAQDGQNRATLLIEHREKSADKLLEQLQEANNVAYRAKVRAYMLKQELHAKNRRGGLFSWPFGGTARQQTKSAKTGDVAGPAKPSSST